MKNTEVTFAAVSKPEPFEPYSFTEFDYFGADGIEQSLEPEYAPRPYAPRTFYAKSTIELNVLRNGLLLTDNLPKSVHKREAPDFKVELISGQTVFIEVVQADIKETGHSRNTITQMSRAIFDWMSANAEFRQRLGGRPLMFTFEYAISKKQMSSVVEEIKNFVVSESFENFPGFLPGGNVPDLYPNLSALQCKVCRPDFDGSEVRIYVSSRHRLNPLNDVDTVLDTLDKKRALARSWNVSPLWLVMGTPRMTFFNAVEAMMTRNRNDISPFSRVVFCHGTAGLVVTSN